MFRKNQRHLQPALISNVQQLPDRQRQRLEQSWAGVFFHEVFCRLNEEPFAVLYADLPSRPNVPVNLLVGLECLKSGFGWSDEELYDSFLYNLQVRYALGYQELGQGEFDIRTLYYFRQRLSRYSQETGINLLDQAFEQITDKQLAAFELKTGKQRMDSTQVGSNIRQQGRLQLLVEILQRVQRMLGQSDQERLAEVFEPYLHGHPGWYVYRLKKEEFATHIEQVGRVMLDLLAELKVGYGECKEYQMLGRVFGEHFRVVEEKVKAREQKELSACSLQSPDDWEATIRDKGNGLHQGYVANLSETCDPDNPFQLITKVQAAPNHTDDPILLLDALPNLVERTDLETLYTDGGYGGDAVDQLLGKNHVQMLQTGIRGTPLDPNKLNMVDFHFQCSETGQPLTVTCPHGQTVKVELGQKKKGFIARFSVSVCQTCPFQQAQQCPTRLRKRIPFYGLYFMDYRLRVTLRRQQNTVFMKTKQNLRSAVEATVRAVKHPFPKGKLPVRGRFRIFCMLIGSAIMNNVRQIQRHLARQIRTKTKSNEKNLSLSSFCLSSWQWFQSFLRLGPALGCCYYVVFAGESINAIETLHWKPDLQSIPFALCESHIP